MRHMFFEILPLKQGCYSRTAKSLVLYISDGYIKCNFLSSAVQYPEDFAFYLGFPDVTRLSLS